MFNDYDPSQYDSVEAAQSRGIPSTIIAPGPSDNKALDSSTTYVCDASIFQWEDGLWRDTTTGLLYRGLSGPEMCPPGVKLRLGEVLSRPQFYIVVLCPELLTQTPGKPKMFATLKAMELTHTRNNVDVNGVQDDLDIFAWDGMSIDDLRQKVLSVYLGLVIMYVQAVKFEKKIIDDDGNTEGYLNSKAKSKYLPHAPIRLTIMQSEDHLTITISPPQRVYHWLRL